MTSLAGSSVSIASTIFSHFNPSKSPFYGVVTFGAISLILSCEGIEHVPWRQIAIPIYIVLFLSMLFSFTSQPKFTPADYEDQLKFARSFSLSSALMSLVITSRQTNHYKMAFYLCYVPCLIQIIVFLLYSYARSYQEDKGSKINFVQFSLITTTFLIGASYSDTQFAKAYQVSQPTSVSQSSSETASSYNSNTGSEDADQKVDNKNIGRRYLEVVIGFYFLWLVCIVYWVKHLFTLIKFTVSIPRDPPQEVVSVPNIID